MLFDCAAVVVAAWRHHDRANLMDIPEAGNVFHYLLIL